MERLDHFYPYLRDEVSFHGGLPGESIRRQVYVTTHPLGKNSSGRLLAACIEEIGADNILFGSDYPHFDANAPSDVDGLPVSADVKRKILNGNAASVFSRIG
jgi:predicted TIM-barrel fold metal-dependent hydrolase